MLKNEKLNGINVNNLGRVFYEELYTDFTLNESKKEKKTTIQHLDLPIINFPQQS